jgi:hypothetical protein
MKRLSLLVFPFAVLLSGCVGGGSATSSSTNASTQPVASQTDRVGVPPSSVSNTAASSNSGIEQGSGYGNGGGGGREERPTVIKTSASLTQAEQTQAQSNRKIVRNAELALEAESSEETQKRISGIAESKNGFVVESQQSSTDSRLTTRDVVNMTIRVPADNFQAALDEIKQASGRVISETVKGQDVTEEFIDIEAQLKAKKALEAQFMEIMKRANTVEDALDVQRQLADVRGEIERIEGRLRFLENQSAMSTIKVRIQTLTAISSNSTGFTYRLTESFGDGIDIALNFVLGLVTLVIGVLPFALFIGLPAFLIGRRLWRGRQRQPMSISDIAKEEIKTE